MNDIKSERTYEDGVKQGRYLATLDALMVMVTQLQLSPKDAMILLKIPKADRKGLVSTIQTRIKQKAAAKTLKAERENK